MNTAEHIVEAYFQYVKRIYTRNNVKSESQTELDIIGVDPTVSPAKYYHIESSVSLSAAYSRITNNKYDAALAKERVAKSGQRRTAGFFIEQKFYSNAIANTYKLLGINSESLERIVVAWKFDTDAKVTLQGKGIVCMTMKEILQELAERLAVETKDIDSDILRTVQLYVRSEIAQPKIHSVATIRKRKNAEKS
jgi:hypothetical protein